MTTITVLLPAGEIPIGSQVSKRTGDKLYTLQDKVKFFHGDIAVPAIRDVETTSPVRFMVSGNGIEVVFNATEIHWHAEPDFLRQWMELNAQKL